LVLFFFDRDTVGESPTVWFFYLYMHKGLQSLKLYNKGERSQKRDT
jgi:hypothetical protein